MLETREKVKVGLSIEVMDMQDITEVERTFQVPFKLYLSWNDGRLKYKNLHEAKAFNLLSENEKSKIWFPIVIFKNTNEKYTTVRASEETKTDIYIEKYVNSWNSESKCWTCSARNTSCSGNCSATPSQITERENYKMYEGMDNQIIIQRYFREIFTCK